MDRYLAGLENPKRATLEEMRRRILEVIPDAEQGLSYAVPAFKVDGKVVAGLAAFKSHLSYLPHSGSVLASRQREDRRVPANQERLAFPVDSPLPSELIRELINIKLGEAAAEPFTSSPASRRPRSLVALLRGSRRVPTSSKGRSWWPATTLEPRCDAVIETHLGLVQGYHPSRVSLRPVGFPAWPIGP